MRTLFCTLFLAAVAAAQSFDRLLPESTVFYASIENASRTKERWGSSRLAALLKDEAMQAFLAKPRSAWAEWMTQLEKDEVFTPNDVLDLLSGQAAVAGVWPEGAKEPAVILLADVGENGEKLQELVKKVEKRLVDEKGDRRDEEEFRSVKIVRYAKADAAAGGEAGAWFLDGKTFAMAETADVLKDLLVRRERGEEGTLASRELYRRTRGRLGARSADLFLYVDAPNLVKGITGNQLVDESRMKIFAALGITAVEGLAAEFAIEPGGLALRVFIPVKGAKTGFLKLLDGKNSALVPPRYVPADALTAGAFTLDMPALWEEARKVMDRIRPGSSEAMDAQIAMVKQQTGVDIATDIIASLGSEIAYHTLTPATAKTETGANSASFSMGAGRFVLSIQLKDRERFEGGLDKLLTAFGFATSTQDYLGVKLRKIPTPFGVEPTIAMLPDRLIFSMSADDVKDVVTRYGKETKGLLDREEMTKALADLPAERFVVSVEDTPKSLSAASSSLAAMMSLFAAGNAPQVADFVDFSLFPSADILAKYIGMNVGCVVNEEDGISYVSVLHTAGG